MRTIIMIIVIILVIIYLPLIALTGSVAMYEYGGIFLLSLAIGIIVTGISSFLKSGSNNTEKKSKKTKKILNSEKIDERVYLTKNNEIDYAKRNSQTTKKILNSEKIDEDEYLTEDKKIYYAEQNEKKIKKILNREKIDKDSAQIILDYYHNYIDKPSIYLITVYISNEFNKEQIKEIIEIMKLFDTPDFLETMYLLDKETIKRMGMLLSLSHDGPVAKVLDDAKVIFNKNNPPIFISLLKRIMDEPYQEEDINLYKVVRMFLHHCEKGINNNEYREENISHAFNSYRMSIGSYQTNPKQAEDVLFVWDFLLKTSNYNEIIDELIQKSDDYPIHLIKVMLSPNFKIQYIDFLKKLHDYEAQLQYRIETGLSHYDKDEKIVQQIENEIIERKEQGMTYDEIAKVYNWQEHNYMTNDRWLDLN